MATKSKRFANANNIETEALIMRAIIQFEMKAHKNDPNFTLGAVSLKTIFKKVKLPWGEGKEMVPERPPLW